MAVVKGGVQSPFNINLLNTCSFLTMTESLQVICIVGLMDSTSTAWCIQIMDAMRKHEGHVV